MRILLETCPVKIVRLLMVAGCNGSLGRSETVSADEPGGSIMPASRNPTGWR